MNIFQSMAYYENVNQRFISDTKNFLLSLDYICLGESFMLFKEISLRKIERILNIIFYIVTKLYIILSEFPEIYFGNSMGSSYFIMHIRDLYIGCYATEIKCRDFQTYDMEKKKRFYFNLMLLLLFCCY